MNKETLQALKESIQKWEGIINYNNIDDGCDDCPLCVLFLKDETEDEAEHHECIKCPVAELVDAEGCSNTPYEEWSNYFYYKKIKIKKVINAETKKLAQDELDFLKSLLPIEKNEKINMS